MITICYGSTLKTPIYKITVRLMRRVVSLQICVFKRDQNDGSHFRHSTTTMRYHTLMFIHVNLSLTYLSANWGIDLQSSQNTTFVVSSYPIQLHRSRHCG
jgi:hypothetical protein